MREQFYLSFTCSSTDRVFCDLGSNELELILFSTRFVRQATLSRSSFPPPSSPRSSSFDRKGISIAQSSSFTDSARRLSNDGGGEGLSRVDVWEEVACDCQGVFAFASFSTPSRYHTHPTSPRSRSTTSSWFSSSSPSPQSKLSHETIPSPITSPSSSSLLQEPPHHNSTYPPHPLSSSLSSETSSPKLMESLRAFPRPSVLSSISNQSRGRGTPLLDGNMIEGRVDGVER